MKSAVNCPDTVSADWGAGPVDQLICPKNNTKISPEQVGDLSVLIMCDSWRAHCSFRFFFSSHTVFYETHTTVQCAVQIKSALLKWFLGMEICRDLTQLSWHKLRWGPLFQSKKADFFHNSTLSFCLMNLTTATISASLCKETSLVKPQPLMNCYYLQSSYYSCL